MQPLMLLPLFFITFRLLMLYALLMRLLIMTHCWYWPHTHWLGISGRRFHSEALRASCEEALDIWFWLADACRGRGRADLRHLAQFTSTFVCVLISCVLTASVGWASRVTLSFRCSIAIHFMSIEAEMQRRKRLWGRRCSAHNWVIPIAIGVIRFVYVHSYGCTSMYTAAHKELYIVRWNSEKQHICTYDTYERPSCNPIYSRYLPFTNWVEYHEIDTINITYTSNITKIQKERLIMIFISKIFWFYISTKSV